MIQLRVFSAVLLLVLLLATAEATYRKPPGLNGSIFGKRTGSGKLPSTQIAMEIIHSNLHCSGS